MAQQERLKAFLEQMYDKKLSEEELKEYRERFVNFVGLLVEIDQKTKKGRQ